jgi:hypothetical protein
VPVSRRVAASLSATIAVVSVAGLSVSAPAQAAPAATAASCRSGVITPSPSPSGFVGLFGISALSPQNVWAVGYYLKVGVGEQALVEHWNGQRWAVVAAPSPGPNAALYDVKAISPSDVWALGLHANGNRVNENPFFEHWNGSAWSVVSSPAVAGFLGALGVGSANDIWAVGARQNGMQVPPPKTLVEHWNGTRWQVVPSPSPSTYGDLLGGVTVAGPNDVWAMGQAGTNRFDHAPLAEHWNGHTWSVVPVPAESFTSYLGGVASAGPNDVWSVGGYSVQSPTGTLLFTLTERWNGHHWSIVASPGPTGDDDLTAVAAVSANDIWAVGSTGSNTTFVLRWTGHAWTTYPGLSRTGAVNALFAVSAPTATDIWVAGGGYKTVVEHLCPPNP